MVVGVVRRGLTSFVLVLIALVPVTGTWCAALCLPATPSAATSGEHHAAPAPCHEPVSEPRRVHGTSGHACDCHIGPADEAAATLTASRKEHGTTSLAQLTGLGSATFFPPPTIHRSRSSPPGPPAFARAPLVLRI
jgi:hypothetical protein